MGSFYSTAETIRAKREGFRPRYPQSKLVTMEGFRCEADFRS